MIVGILTELADFPLLLFSKFFLYSYSKYEGWKSRDAVPKLVNDYMSKKLMVDEFVTFSLPLVEINEAFEYMHTGKR